MSRDFQLAWQCPHLTVEEHVTLGADRQSLNTRQPIASSGTVRLMANNDDRLFIPQSGLYTTARLLSTDSGPFDLTANTNELTVTTSAGEETFSFGVTSIARLSTSQVVQRLRQNGITVAVPENINSHLALTDVGSVGPDSFVRVRGSAVTALGFGSTCGNNRQRGARGKRLYPGWQLLPRPASYRYGTRVSDELYPPDSTDRFPKFAERINNNPMFKVTYTAPSRSCLRCGGTFIENDFRFDTTGQGLTIENENLLYQAALKILLTDRGSNPYHDWYGSTIRSRIGSKAVAGVAAQISEDVRRALSNMQTVQQEQAEYQQVTAKERLYNILQVRTAPHVQDPTTFLVDVTVQNASSEAVALSIVFSVPEVVALLGSNGLFLGTEAVGLQRELSNQAFAGGRTLLPVNGG